MTVHTEVSQAGLPVDMTTLPVPPQMQVRVARRGGSGMR